MSDPTGSPRDGGSNRYQSLISSLSWPSVAWLAVAPVWTKRLAETVGFPTAEQGVDGFVKLASKAGICLVETRPAARPTKGNSPTRSAVDAATRSEVITLVAARLGGDLAKRALQAASQVDDDTVRCRVIVALAPVLEGRLVGDARELAASIASSDLRAQAMTALANVASGADRDELARQAADAVIDAPPRERALVLAEAGRAASPETGRPWIEEVLATAGNLPERQRSRLLSAVAPAIPEGLQDTFTALAVEIHDPVALAQVMSVAAHMDLLAPGLVDVDPDAGQGAGQPNRGRNSLIASLASALTLTGNVDDGIRRIEQLSDGPSRGRGFGALAVEAVHARRLDDGMKLAHLASRELSGTVPSAEVAVLVEIAAAFLEAGDLPRASELLGAADAIEMGNASDLALPQAALAGLLERAGSHEAAVRRAMDAYQLAVLGQDARTIVRVVGAVADLLPPPLRGEAIEEATRWIRRSDEPLERGWLLAQLADVLTTDGLDDLLETTLRLVDDEGEDVTYWMPDDIRPDVVRVLRRAESGESLRTTAQRVAQAVGEAGERGAPMPPDLAEWAAFAGSLAKTGDAGAIAESLKRDVAAALERGDRWRAIALTSAAATTAVAIGAELDPAVTLARRTINVNYRQAHDEARLAEFVERREQLLALDALLGRDPRRRADQWALHLLGMGGVGKTMLVRYLTTRLAAERNLATARIDFDYISPDFPLKKPGELLLEFVGDLLDADPATSYVTELQATIRRYHEYLTARQSSGEPSAAAEDPLATIHDPIFAQIIGQFGDVIDSISRPVVLILDTCEELAKGEPEGERLPGIDAMFEILERIEERSIGLRVVFAGRRPLARAGYGWSLEGAREEESDAEASETNSQLRTKNSYLPSAKDYLQLHEIRGFDREESLRYLRDRKKLVYSEASLDLILKVSKDVGTAADIEWDPPRPARRRRRFNPFDLAINAEWARELGRELSEDDLSSGGRDLYVERRILDRLGPEVRGLVPAAALLRRFDEQMIAPAYEGFRRDLPQALGELASQEWIDRKIGASDVEYCEVDRNHQDRLDRYYAGPGRADRERAAAKLAIGIERIVRQRPLAELPYEAVDAALRIPSIDQSRLWQDLAADLVGAADWPRIHDFTGRLLDVDGAINAIDHPLAAAVRDLRAVALARLESPKSVERQLRTVARVLADDPSEANRVWIGDRARARDVAKTLRAAGKGGATAVSDDLRTFADRVRSGAYPTAPRALVRGDAPPPASRAEQVAAAWCAGLEELVDGPEARRREIDAGSVDAWASSLAELDFSPEVVKFAGLLAGRARALDGHGAAGLARILSTVDEAAPRTRQRWFDWQAPDNIDDRARLEAILINAAGPGRGAADGNAGDALERWLAAPATLSTLAGRLESIDSERLASAVLAWQLDRGVVPVDDLQRLAAADAYRLDRRAVCAAHEATAPLFVNVARGFLGAGRPDVAIEVLSRHREDAAATQKDESTVRAATAGLLRVARRMRLPRLEAASVNEYAETVDRDKLELALPVLALARGIDEPALDGPVAQSEPSVWWSCQTLVRPERTATIDRLRMRDAPIPSGDIPARSTFEKVSQTFDVMEAGWHFAETGGSLEGWGFDHEAWANAHPDLVDEAITLTLRAAALWVPIQHEPFLAPTVRPNGAPGPPKPPPKTISATERLSEWSSRVGRHRVAELAFEAGELLALRLPKRAMTLLEYAAGMYEAVDDPVGVLLVRSRLAMLTVQASQGRKSRPDTLAISQLEKTYREVVRRVGDTSLPSWEQLMAGQPTEILDSADNPWTPWLRRIAVALRPFTEEVARYSQLVPATPTELIPQFFPERETSTRPLRSLLFGCAVLIIVFGVIPLIIGGISGSAIGGFVVVGLVLAVGVLLYLRRGVAEFLRGSFAGLVRFRIAAAGTEGAYRMGSPGDFAGAGTASLSLTVRGPTTGPKQVDSVRQFLGALISFPFTAFERRPRYEQRGATVTGTMRFAPDASYEDVAVALPGPVGERLTASVGKARRSYLPISITTDRASASLPWEAALIGAPIGERSSSVDSRVEPYRLGTGSPDVTSQAPKGRAPVMLLAADAWSSMGVAGWGGPARVSLAAGLSDAVAQKPRVLHVIGRPVETSRGMQLEIVRDETKTRLMPGSGTELSVSPQDLPLADTTLVVLQAQPDEVRPRRSTDRERAAKLRVLGSELQESGATSVLLIPPVPSVLGQGLIGIVSKRLATRSLRARLRRPTRIFPRPERGDPEYALWELLETGREVRREIIAWAAENLDEDLAEAALELALDVTVFTRASARELAMDGSSIQSR